MYSRVNPNDLIVFCVFSLLKCERLKNTIQKKNYVLNNKYYVETSSKQCTVIFFVITPKPNYTFRVIDDD